MANTNVRPVGYTGSLQQLTWNYGNGTTVSSYLWGGGGGGGGNDSGPGGRGGGGGFSAKNFTINNGDVLTLAVGGGGRAGLSGQRGGAGGAAGASFIGEAIFNSRTATPVTWTTPQGTTVVPTPVINVSYPAWPSFLNTYGIWQYNDQYPYFQNAYQLNVPTSGYYTLTLCVDNYGTADIYGPSPSTTLITSLYNGAWPTPTQQTIYMTAGTYHLVLSGVNTGYSPGIALTIGGGGVSYSGGTGGASGYSGYSGSGGGGGGATLLLLNGSVIAVAGGGGGAGGGGNPDPGKSAPGARGQSGSSTAGQAGESKQGDGGGGGGGGGGANGGQGGDTPGGDIGGNAGVYGSNTGDSVSNPSGRSPGGTNNSYYVSGIAQGGATASNGTNGYAVLTFDLPGVFVHYNGDYVPVNKTWVKNNGTWSQAQAVWVKQGGTWSEVLGGTPPFFTPISGNFGIDSRPFG